MHMRKKNEIKQTLKWLEFTETGPFIFNTVFFFFNTIVILKITDVLKKQKIELKRNYEN